MYFPSGDGAADAATRAALYRRIEQHLLPATTVGADLVLGDMNAALRGTDRTHALYAKDKAHQTAVVRLGLRSFEAPGATPRLKTYHTAEGLVSRIDDVLTTCPEIDLQAWRQHIQVVTDTWAGNDTDHDALIVSVPWETLDLEPPIQPATAPRGRRPADAPRKLLTPISPLDKDLLQRTLEERQGSTWATLRGTLAGAVNQHLRAHHAQKQTRSPGQPFVLESVLGRPARECLEDWGQQITRLTVAAQAIAEEVCDTAPMNGGHHYRSRGVAKEWLRLK